MCVSLLYGIYTLTLLAMFLHTIENVQVKFCLILHIFTLFVYPFQIEYCMYVSVLNLIRSFHPEIRLVYLVEL